jgi:MoaA/NifB/PqqE/SkfB family radical SAM enzyme
VGKIKSLAEFGLEVGRRFITPKMSHVNFVITDRCNFRCKTCGIWGYHGQPNRDMTDDDILAIYGRNHILWSTLTGGEPTLNPEFKHVLTTAMLASSLVQVNTNGYLSDRLVYCVENALSLTRRSLLVISVSLFGDKNTHDAITQSPGAFDHVMDTIYKLKRVKASRLILGLAFTASPYNENQYEYVSKLARSLKIGLTFAWERHSGYYGNASDKSVYIPQMPPVRVSMNPLTTFENFFVLNHSRRAGCVAGEYSCWIAPNLDVYPCIFTYEDQKQKCFNLRQTGFKLDGEFEGVKQWVKQCQGCWIACETYAMLMWRPWRLLRFHSH